MKKYCLSILVCLLLLTGCASKAIALPEPTTSPPTSATNMKPQNIVYANAKKDFLAPIEQHSWERQFTPEFVMLHFTNTVANNPQDPYNLDDIRALFLEYDVSIHYIIDRDGTIYCYIPENHACADFHLYS